MAYCPASHAAGQGGAGRIVGYGWLTPPGRNEQSTSGSAFAQTLGEVLDVFEKNPVLIDVPMPIRTPRLLVRPKQAGDGALTASAIAETWEDLHRWMGWAEDLADHTAERQEIRARQVMASFILREEFNLVGIEVESGKPVIWCGYHGVDWNARHCETGFWVRRSAQGRGFATEATNALLRYAFGALGMRRVGITHSRGNEASRRVIEKLGFACEGVMRKANSLSNGRVADRCCYARLSLEGMPPLEVRWGED